jgi:hypothetical protein
VGKAFTARVTAMAQVQHSSFTAQHLLQQFQPVGASAVSHLLQPISLQLTGWQHDMHPRAAITMSIQHFT